MRREEAGRSLILIATQIIRDELGFDFIQNVDFVEIEQKAEGMLDTRNSKQCLTQ
jgi:hypothetical protein